MRTTRSSSSTSLPASSCIRAPGNSSGTLVNALIAHCGASLSGIGGVARPGIVHRLDKDTSGVLVVAKTDQAHRALVGAIRRPWPRGRARARLSRARLGRTTAAPRHDRRADRPPPTSRTKMAVLPNKGREAVTHYRVLETFGETRAAPSRSPRCSNARSRPGARIRSACISPHIGTPLIGDPLYAQGFKSKLRNLPEPLAQKLMQARPPGAARCRARLHPSEDRHLTGI